MFKSKLTTIVAITALVIAVFGATPLGQAAGRLVLPKNSVGAAQLKKNSVANRKIAKNAITSPKVKDGSLLAADFKAGQLQAGPQGPKGDPGRQGPKGDTGATGSPGLSGLEIVEKTEFTSSAALDASAYCPAGKRAIAAGGTVHAPPGHLGEVALVAVNPVNVLGTGFGHVYAEGINGLSPGTWSLTATVTCAYVK